MTGVSIESKRASDNIQRAVNPLLSLSWTAGRCWIQCNGCDDGRSGHWHEISRGLAICLTGGTWRPWE